MKNSIVQSLILSLGIHALILFLMILAEFYTTKNLSENLQTHLPKDLRLCWGHTSQGDLNSPPLSKQPVLPDSNSPRTTAPTSPSENSSPKSQSEASPVSPNDPYYSQVRARILSQVTYPTELIRRRMTGQVLLRIWISPKGALEQLALEKSSGHPELDELAQRSVRLAAPFEPFIPPKLPASDALQPNTRQILIPIDYQRSF